MSTIQVDTQIAQPTQLELFGPAPPGNAGPYRQAADAGARYVCHRCYHELGIDGFGQPGTCPVHPTELLHDAEAEDFQIEPRGVLPAATAQVNARYLLTVALCGGIYLVLPLLTHPLGMALFAWISTALAYLGRERPFVPAGPQRLPGGRYVCRRCYYLRREAASAEPGACGRHPGAPREDSTVPTFCLPHHPDHAARIRPPFCPVRAMVISGGALLTLMIALANVSAPAPLLLALPPLVGLLSFATSWLLTRLDPVPLHDS